MYFFGNFERSPMYLGTYRIGAQRRLKRVVAVRTHSIISHRYTAEALPGSLARAFAVRAHSIISHGYTAEAQPGSSQCTQIMAFA